MSLASRWHLPLLHAALWFVLAVLAGCGTAPRSGPAMGGERDGPGANPPADLAQLPDAVPRLESIRIGGPNKPYEVLGHRYVPMTDDRPFSERGLASWYGRKFHGRRTANGEVYDMYAMTAAHPTMPLPSYARVRNPANGREAVVRINDRGPFHAGRIIDLSYAAAYKLGLLKGVAPVEVTRITYDEIRAGTWRKETPSDMAVPTPARDAAAVAAVRPAETPREVAEVASPAANPVPITDAAPDVPPALATVSPATATAAVPAAGTDTAPSTTGFWVQLGAFRQREGADLFQRRVGADLGWLAPVLAVFADPSAYRLQAGPYASREEAQGVAQRVRDALQLVPLIVERQ
jgi:rare lipoprotein A